MKPTTKRDQTIPDAFFFDFDGVISDTEPLHWRAFRDVLKPLGLRLSWRAYVERYLGFDDRGVFRTFFSDQRRALPPTLLKKLLASKADAFERLVRSGVIDPYPGVVPLIRSIRYAGIPVALCTGALRRDIRPLLRRFRLTRAFDVIVTADDVHEGKPNPRAYRIALQQLRKKFPNRRIRASHSVAIEDTPAGIAAAQGAGLRALAVANTYPVAQLFAASAIVKKLTDLRLSEIGERVLKAGVRDRTLLPT